MLPYFISEDAVTSDAQEKITRKRDNSDLNQRKGFNIFFALSVLFSSSPSVVSAC
jgi:hypothetical protein